MRRKPITRDEIRFNGQRITTLPVDAVDKDFEPIARLWAPLLRRLKVECPQPSPYHAFLPPCTCRQCGRKFYRVELARDLYCSDVCADAARQEHHAKSKAKWIKARTEERAANRADRLCAHCGTLRFCSAYCRVAANRAARRSERASDHR